MLVEIRIEGDSMKRKQKHETKLYGGIDLHGNNLTVAIVDANGTRIVHSKLPCEIYAVVKFLASFKDRLESLTVESTYNWYWLVDGLQDAGFKIYLANPSGIEQYEGLKHADDKSDAYFLAELLRLGILPKGYIYEREGRSVRDLFRRRMLLVRKRTALILSLRSLHVRLKGSPLPLKVVKSMKPKEVAEMFENPADQLAATAEKLHIDQLGQTIDTIEKTVAEQASKTPNYSKIQTIPGIGVILGTTIAMEIGDIDRFPSAEDFASYCRTVPASKRSNGKKKGENNRKCGNRYLGWAFIEAANSIRRFDENAKRWHDRKASRTNSIIATKALACKLSKAVWYIVKNGTIYDAARLFGAADSARKQTSEGSRKPDVGE